MVFFDFLILGATIWCILSWRNPQKYMPFLKKPKIWKIVGIWFLSISLIGGTKGAIYEEEIAQYNAEQKVKEEHQQKMDLSKELQLGLAATEEQAIKAHDLLTSLGFTKIEDVQPSYKGENELGYSFKANQTGKGVAVFYTNNDKEITKVIMFNHVLYDNGEKPEKISDFMLSSGDKSQAKYIAKEIVKENLKNPKSADFDTDNFMYSKKDGLVYVTGIVRATNSFGGVVPNKFKCAIDVDKGNGLLISFE